MNMTTVIYQRWLSRYIVFVFLVLKLVIVLPEAIIDQGDDDLSISDDIDEDAAATLMTIRQIELQHPPISHSANNSASTGGLIWNHLSVPTSSSNDSKHSFLLHETSGMVANGRILGIIGPSGSGKTILLQTLLRSSAVSSSSTCRRHHNNVYQYHYHSSHNNNHSNTLTLASIPSQQIAYISQTDHDAFFDQLTVYETLQFAYFIETMSRPTSRRRNGDMHHPNQRIQSTINQLGLQHVTHHQIGSSSSSSRSSSSSKSPSNKWLTRWIPQHGIRRAAGGRLSGGERRRLSVGLELVASREDHKKILLLADEPTSGLDSTYSRIVLTLLRTLVRTQNIPALIALHQPSSYVWNHILDDILLLAPGGYVCYIGRRDMMIPYFAQIGYAVPEYTNPSEFFLELVSIHTENTTQAALDEERIQHLYNTFRQYQQKLLSPSTKERIITMMKQNRINVSYVSSLAAKNVNVANTTNTTEHDDHTRQDRLFTSLTQLPFIRSIRRILALFRRSWRQNIRDVNMNLSRLCVSVGNAFLLAGVFPSVQKGSQHRPLISSIADRVALLSFGAINLCMMTYMKSITLFAHESPIIQRELNARQQYTVFEYLVAKVSSELPIDMIFSLIFAVILKHFTGLRISLQQLSQVFAVLTTAGASLGFLLGSTATSYQHATTSGVPVLVILMVVGVINPSGVDVTKPKPFLLRYLKQISPFAYAIEALCIAEYRGVQFYANDSDRGGGGKLGSVVARLKDSPRMGGLAMITNGDEVLNALGMKHQTYKATMMHLALISLGNLVCSWLGLLWKERQQRHQYSSTCNSYIPDSLPESSSFTQQTKLTSETSHMKQNIPIQVPVVRRII